MRFNNDKPIFMQIADLLTRQVISGELAPGSRLASARELATNLEVNPNTAVRALQLLAESGVARSERGTGYFVDPEGQERARQALRKVFFETELPALFTTMDQLGIRLEEIQQHYGERPHENQ